MLVAEFLRDCLSGEGYSVYRERDFPRGLRHRLSLITDKVCGLYWSTPDKGHGGRSEWGRPDRPNKNRQLA